jgi:hypothetical protein
MDELDDGHSTEGYDARDADDPLTRDDSTWFARQLGDDWRPDEPGIYRYVGPSSRSEPENGDVVAHGDANGHRDGENSRRWVPWRRD